MKNIVTKVEPIETLPELLIIEDDDLVIKSVQKMTMRYVRSVTATRSTAEGLTIIENLPVNSLVVSDIDNNFHPDISGIKVAEQSHPTRKIKNIPLILISGGISNRMDRIGPLMEQGIVNATAEKPLDYYPFYSLIRSVHLKSLINKG